MKMMMIMTAGKLGTLVREQLRREWWQGERVSEKEFSVEGRAPRRKVLHGEACVERKSPCRGGLRGEKRSADKTAP
jgi:hypothetical protein